jgi:hypothetical protein
MATDRFGLNQIFSTDRVDITKITDNFRQIDTKAAIAEEVGYAIQYGVERMEYSNASADNVANVKSALDALFAGGGSSSGVVDQEYDPSSANAQSGKAVAFAVQMGLDSLQDTGVNIIYYHVPDNSEPPMPIRTMLDKVWAHDAALGDIDTALDNIIAIQNELIGGAE